MTQHILRVTKDFVLSLERRTAIHDGTNQSDLFVIEQPEELGGFVCTLDFRNSAFKNKFIVTGKTFPMYAEMAVHGRLDLQLEYSQGDTVRLTNMVQMPIGESIKAFDHLDPANANVLGQLAEQVRYLEKRMDALGDGGGGIQGEQGIQGERGEQGIQGERGEQGEQGEQGVQGIQGERGEQGIQGIQGERGEDGRDGQDGLNGTDGRDGLNGLSAFELAKENGFEGTLQEWLASLQGGGGGEPPYYGVARVVYDQEISHGIAFTTLCQLKSGGEYVVAIDALGGVTGNVQNVSNDVRINLLQDGNGADFHDATSHAGTLGLRISFTHMSSLQQNGRIVFSNRINSIRRTQTAILSFDLSSTTSSPALTHNNPSPSATPARSFGGSTDAWLRFHYPVAAVSRLTYRVFVTETIPEPLEEV